MDLEGGSTPESHFLWEEERSTRGQGLSRGVPGRGSRWGVIEREVDLEGGSPLCRSKGSSFLSLSGKNRTRRKTATVEWVRKGSGSLKRFLFDLHLEDDSER